MDTNSTHQGRKVLFVTMEFWPFRGGVARYYKNFCDAYKDDLTVYVVEGAPESRSTKFEIRNSKLESDNEDSNPEKGTPYSVIRKTSYWKWMRPRWGKLLIDLYWYVKKYRPAVVFVGHMLPIGLIALLLQRLFHFDYGVFLHGLDVQFAHRGRWHRRFVTNAILQNSCLIIVNSEYTKHETAKAFGIPAQKIMVLWPKAYQSEVESRKSKVESTNADNVMVSMPALPRRGRSNHDVKEALRQAQGDIQLPIVLSVGRLVPRKGFDDVIEVAKHFIGKAQFIIFGRGNDEMRLRSLIAHHGLESTVSLITDDLSDKDMDALYNLCDVFLFLPKELRGGDVEGFGQVALEAQAHGKPVIVRNSGGSGEALIDGVTGYLVNDFETCRSKLELLLSDGDLRKRMGEKGKEFANNVGEGFGEHVSALKDALLELTKKVSVIIPNGYDLKKIIPTLKSLEQQTYKNIEVLIVGDGIDVKKLPITSYRLQIITIVIPKSGAAAARNAGAGQTAGDYLLFVDDDTVLREDCIEKMVRRLEVRSMSLRGDKSSDGRLSATAAISNSDNHQSKIASRHTHNDNKNVDFVYSGFKLGWKTFPSVPFNCKTAYQYPYFDVTSMIRRDTFPRFDESLKRLQDWDLFLTILDNGGVGEPMHEVLYYKSARLFKNLIKQKGISFWFPRLIWKLPIASALYSYLPVVRKYREAVAFVKAKHEPEKLTNPF